MNNTKELINNIKNSKYLKKLIDDNHITDEMIDQYLFVFEDSYNSINICDKCNGINNCKQSIKGEVCLTCFNSVPFNTYKSCKYKKSGDSVLSFKELYVYSDIPMDLYNIRLNNIDVTDDDETQTLLHHLFNKILNGERNKGVYVIGDYGIGKTYLTIALANSLVEKGYKVAFIKTNDFVTDMSSYNSDPDTRYLYNKILNEIKKCDYVFFDDIGSETVSEASRDRLLDNILDYRMENKMCTLFTSNMSIDMLRDHYNKDNNAYSSNHIMERVRALSDVFVLKGSYKRG